MQRPQPWGTGTRLCVRLSMARTVHLQVHAHMHLHAHVHCRRLHRRTAAPPHCRLPALSQVIGRTQEQHGVAEPGQLVELMRRGFTQGLGLNHSPKAHVIVLIQLRHAPCPCIHHACMHHARTMHAPLCTAGGGMPPDAPYSWPGGTTCPTCGSRA